MNGPDLLCSIAGCQNPKGKTQQGSVTLQCEFHKREHRLRNRKSTIKKKIEFQQNQARAVMYDKLVASHDELQQKYSTLETKYKKLLDDLRAKTHRRV